MAPSFAGDSITVHLVLNGSQRRQIKEREEKWCAKTLGEMFSLWLKWFPANCWINWYWNDCPSVTRASGGTLESGITTKRLCNMIWQCDSPYYCITHVQVSVAPTKGVLVAISRPGCQQVLLLLVVEAVQLVQVSSQLEHPCCRSITLLTIAGHSRRVTVTTITVVLSSSRSKMTFIGMLACLMQNLTSNSVQLCTEIAHYCVCFNLDWKLTKLSFIF